MNLKQICILFLIGIAFSCNTPVEKPLLSHVNTLIGTATGTKDPTSLQPGNMESFGQTTPAITAPFAMTQWTPQTTLGEHKCNAPFYFGQGILNGFRATHWTSGSCVKDYGSFTLMPISGEASHLPQIRRATLLIDSESLTPAYGAFHLMEYEVIAEITATKRSGMFRLSWANPTNPAIVFDINNNEGKGFISYDPERKEIVAENPVSRLYNGNGQSAGFSGYMVVKFDCEISGFTPYSDYQLFSDSTQLFDMPRMGAKVSLSPPENNIVHIKIGTSFTSLENARENLEAEIPGWDFYAVKSNLESTWEKLLGTIRVEGGTPEQTKEFYTAIYHSCLHPRLYSDVDGSYPGFGDDSSIHVAEGFDYYCDFSAWDTYRAQMPLLSIIAPKEYQDMMTSLVKKADQGGWLPTFPMWNSYTSAMIGDHAGAILGDAIMKGFEIDNESAWKYIRQNAFEIPADFDAYTDGKGRRGLRTYLEYGYIPLEDEVLEAFHTHEQVSRTLEYSYNDWVLSQVASKLGHESDAEELTFRAQNYRNVFDPDKGWVCGRFTDGTFTDEFEADKPMYYITEGTPKHYTWYVPHDPTGLMELMGGKDNYLARLQHFIDNKEYWHGNEPSHHIPYMFNFAGRWDLTQKTVKNILDTEYQDNAGGLPGNDDAGQLSAWYVFSSMGFYPVAPGSNEYQLSSPVFSKVTLKLDKKYYDGKNFVLETNATSDTGIFSKVKLNGKDSGTVLKHEDLVKGGKLSFMK
ncbi:alpha-1,2-mannosidase, putative [Bacteroidales bacterium 6E]|nr:alpha-1,2-mannosidase, putative [Bacteroidales bacterium 6E]